MGSSEEDEFKIIVSQRQKILTEVDQLFSKARSFPDGDSLNVTSSVSDDKVLRRLLPSETLTLQQSCHCKAKDWSKIYLILPPNLVDSDQSETLQDVISDTRFDGIIILDLSEEDSICQEEKEDTKKIDDYHLLPPGIHSNLLISDSMFNVKSCRVHRNSLIRKTFVASNAILLQCGHISVDTTTDTGTYGQLTLSVGPEAGGSRILQVTSEHTMVDICQQLKEGPSSFPVSTTEGGLVIMNVLGNECVVRDTPTLTNIFLHERSSIVAATEVIQTTIFPKASIHGSCTVSKALLQWNSSIVHHSSVCDVFLMEESHIGPNSIVVSTILGTDVHVSAGEVHTSIIGPNTNAHHQSLLIGILWPLGRGNVGYGANVGSNHTGRLPDQETTTGEGIFWGLSTIIKFPVDLSFSPYSIIAAGTILPPQRICMPFSLIVTSSNGNNGGNDILPGWVLQSSPYTLVRSEKKYETRRKAKRHYDYTGWKIFRPETMAMCRWAKTMLLESDESLVEIHGIGTCTLTPKAREAGIKAYTECLQRYALQGLLGWVMQLMRDSGEGSLDLEVIRRQFEDVVAHDTILNIDPLARIEWPSFPWEMRGTIELRFQQALLMELFPLGPEVSVWLEGVLQQLVTLEQDFARRIRSSKARDDDRGANTIPDYAMAHVPADKDQVISDADEYALGIDCAVSDVLISIGVRSQP